MSSSHSDDDRDDEDLFSEANISLDEEDEDGPAAFDGERHHHDDDEGDVRSHYTEYYALLGLPVNASPVEIRRAFLQLSRRYHTDKHSGASLDVQEAMSERFQELTRAYTVLSDPRQRIAYDLKGKKGANHLALVPKNVQSSQDIVDIVRALDRAAKLQHMSRMLSSTSEIEIEYTTVPLFQWASTAMTMARNNKSGDGTSPQENQEESPTHVKRANAEEGEEEEEEEEEKVEVPPLTDVLQGSSAELAQANVNGRMVYILVPDQERISQFVAVVKKKQALEQRRNAMERHNVSQSDLAQLQRRLLPLVLGARVLLPKGVSISHSFKHALSANSYVQLSGEANSTTRPSMKADYFVKDPETNNEKSIRTVFSMQKCGVILSQLVHLSALWSLGTKLCLFDGLQVLKFFDIQLLRKLSPSTVLDSKLRMSLFEEGDFTSSIRSDTFFGSVLFGAKKLRFFGAWGSEMDLFPRDILTAGGLGSTTSGRGKKKTPSGVFSCFFVTSPITGLSVIEWSFKYAVSRYFKLGIGFSVSIPYAPSPFAPPYFIVQAAAPMTNTVKFVYERGNHTLSIPVAVFISDSLSKSVVWLTAPMMVIRLCMLLYIPFAKSYAGQFYSRERAKHIPEMDIARQKALLEQEALESSVLSSRAVEERKSGLVILLATYGVLYREYGSDAGSAPGSPTVCSFVEQPPLLTRAVSRVSQWLYRVFASRHYKERTGFTFPLRGDAHTFPTVSPEEQELTSVPLSLDVSVPLQNLVRDSALTLPAGTKATLTGFYDPDPYTAEKKQLKIVYLFRGKRHVIVLNDEDEVLIPQREHLETSDA